MYNILNNFSMLFYTTYTNIENFRIIKSSVNYSILLFLWMNCVLLTKAIKNKILPFCIISLIYKCSLKEAILKYNYYIIKNMAKTMFIIKIHNRWLWVRVFAFDLEGFWTKLWQCSKFVSLHSINLQYTSVKHSSCN